MAKVTYYDWDLSLYLCGFEGFRLPLLEHCIKAMFNNMAIHFLREESYRRVGISETMDTYSDRDLLTVTQKYFEVGHALS